MIQSSIRNSRIISGSISIDEAEMKQQGCLGIFSECKEVEALAMNVSKRRRKAIKQLGSNIKVGLGLQSFVKLQI